MLSTLLVMALGAAPAAAPSAAKADKPKLIVLDLVPGGGVDATVAAALTEALTQEIADRKYFQVLASKEVQTMLGFERQKQMVGCSEETNCLTELGGALGASFVLSGSVTKLGDAYQLSLQTMDSKRAQPLARASRLASNIKALREGLAYLAAEATATPLPPPPSRVLPYSLLGGGALALIGSGLLAVNAIAQEDAVNRALLLGTTVGTTIGTLDSYQAESRQIATKKTISLLVLLAGSGLIAGGVALNPPELGRPQGGVAVRLVPAADGVALVGVMP